jgi:hypothetical protein
MKETLMKHDDRVNFKMPAELVEAVADIAKRRMMSRSAYLRQATLEKLEKDGVRLMPDFKPAA